MSDSARSAEPTRCGFVAMLGAPNVGKSTLVNRLVGSKVSIVSPKAQTTRSRISGVAIQGRAQIILVDLPGVFEPRRRLDRAMVDAAWRGAEDADFSALVVDATRGADRATAALLEGLAQRGLKPILVVNKIDLVKPTALLRTVDTLNRSASFQRTFLVSAATGDGCADLLAYLAKELPEGPWLYPEDHLTDLSERLVAAEVTREQAFLKLHQEIPYAIAVETERWEEFENGEVRLEQTIYVQREGQRKIVIGDKGAMIREIGAAARAELSRIIGRKVHLFLHVKVAKDWAERRDFYRAWGLEFDV